MIIPSFKFSNKDFHSNITCIICNQNVEECGHLVAIFEKPSGSVEYGGEFLPTIETEIVSSYLKIAFLPNRVIPAGLLGIIFNELILYNDLGEGKFYYESDSLFNYIQVISDNCGGTDLEIELEDEYYSETNEAGEEELISYGPRSLIYIVAQDPRKFIQLALQKVKSDFDEVFDSIGD